MKIIHLPDTFLPYSTGGKEVFVYHLAEALTVLGHENIVVIHRNDKVNADTREYFYGNIRVIVLDSIKISHLQYWKKESTFNHQFEELLKTEKPDIIHFHDQSGGASLSHLRMAKQLGFKTVLTYHSPGQSCPQHALLRNGKILCDGYLSAYRCASCLLYCRGIKYPLNKLLALPIFQSAAGENNRALRLFTYYSNINYLIQAFKETYQLHNAIHVHANWVKNVLLINGVKKDKIFFSAQGLPKINCKNNEERLPDVNTNVLKLLFIGRCTYIKGVHILIEAIKKLSPEIPVEVHFIGPYWNDTTYARKLLRKIKNDVRFKSPILLQPQQVHEYMRNMDACIIPSLWPETGPLVMLEALQNGVPVIASNFSGMAEKIQHGVNGLLFERGNSTELAKCIEILYERKKSGKVFNISPVRDVIELASDMVSLYHKVLGAST